LLAVLVGACFGVSGLVFQTLFNNPLTTPYTLGIASGASFGAALAICFGLDNLISSISGVSLAAVLGALLVTILIVLISRFSFSNRKEVMLLCGVALSFFFSSLMLLISYLSDVGASFKTLRWLMGGLEVVGFEKIISLAPFVILGVLAAQFFSLELDVLSTGEELAVSRGVRVDRVRAGLFAAISLMVGVCVSLVGPIGFIGLIVPHIVKMLGFAGHAKLIPATAILSASFLVLCDFISRLIIYPVEIPIGVITSLVGAPFFIWILIRAFARKPA
jgi:iron complex transport system permease protein